MKEHRISKLNNKRGYSTEGSTLLPSVLRPRLFGIGVAISTIMAIGTSLDSNSNQASAVSATLSIPEGISVNVNPSVDNGFAESSNGAVSVSTGNQAGYTLTIKAKDNNQLKNGSNVLNSISTNLTTDQYKNGDYANTWGFKPSEINNNANTSYVPGPNSSTGITLASTHASSNDAENYSIGIAAKVDSNTIAGNYTNTFTISATANEARYNIVLNKNGGSGGPSTGTANYTQTGDIGSSTYVKIKSGEPTKSGVDFLGWCSVNPGTGDTCNGVLVQSDGQFPLCKCDLNITLYAMYGAKPITPGTNGASCTVAGHTGKYYGGYCWQWMDASGGSTWDQAKTVCNSMGWSLPTQAQFQSLLNAIGSGSQLYNAGWSGLYWSSTPYGSSIAHRLYINSSSAIFDGYYATGDTAGVRCVSQQYLLGVDYIQHSLPIFQNSDMQLQFTVKNTQKPHFSR